MATRAPDRKAAWSIIRRNLAAAAVDAIDSLFARNRTDQPKVVVVPEFALQGPPHGENVGQWIRKACYPSPGDISAPLQECARRHGIYIGANQFEAEDRWPSRFFNCSFLFDPQGEIVIWYRRISTAVWLSPRDFRDAYLAEYGPSGTFPVASTELGRLAVIPCGEIAVPEIVRVFTMRGAEDLLYTTNEAKSPGQEAATVARAAENMIYAISTNVEAPIEFSLDDSIMGGRSQIIDYHGDRIAFEAGPEVTFSASASSMWKRCGERAATPACSTPC